MPCPPPYIGVDGTFAGALPFPSTSSLLSCYTPLICGLVLLKPNPAGLDSNRAELKKK